MEKTYLWLLDGDMYRQSFDVLATADTRQLVKVPLFGVTHRTAIHTGKVLRG